MKLKRILITVLTAILVLGIFPLNAFAASASISGSTSVTVGSTFSVTFKFSTSNISSVQANFSYDRSVLQYVSGADADGRFLLDTNDQNASSLSTTVKFKALKAGSATISVSANGIDWNGTEFSVNSSKTVTVKEASTATQSTAPATSKAPEASPTPTVNPVSTAIPVTLDGQTLYLWTTLTGVTPPSGFTIADSTYQGQAIQAATGNSLTLVYLTDQSGQNGSFYVLDNEAIYPYLTVSSNKAFTILKPDSTVVIPTGYTQTTMDLSDHPIQAWSTAEKPDFYLLYAMNSQGNKGFYTYDTVEGTLQRYSDITVAVDAAPAKITGFFEVLKSNPVLMIVFIALSALALTLAIICIVLIIKKANAGRPLETPGNGQESQPIEPPESAEEPQPIDNTEETKPTE